MSIKSGHRPLTSSQRLADSAHNLASPFCGRLVQLLFFLLALTAGSTVWADPANSHRSGDGIPLDPQAGTVWCGGSYYSPNGEFVDIYLAMRDPSWNVIASEYAGGYGGAYVEVAPAVTYTGDYLCSAEYFVAGEPAGYDEGTIHVYVLMLDIVVNTFIPDNHTALYNPGYGDWIAGEGDDRSFNKSGSTRTNQFVTVISPAVTTSLVTTYYPATGLTEVYDYNTSVGGGVLTAQARNDWVINDHYLKIYFGQPSGATLSCSASKDSVTAMTLYCSGDEATPYCGFGFFCPGITYDFYLTFWFYANNTIEYLVSGSHDNFPNYEVYVGNQLMYPYDHGGHGLEGLFPPTDVSVYAPGSVQ